MSKFSLKVFSGNVKIFSGNVKIFSRNVKMFSGNEHNVLRKKHSHNAGPADLEHQKRKQKEISGESAEFIFTRSGFCRVRWRVFRSTVESVFSVLVTY
jgi:lipopolysaccharide export system protein LptA